MRGRSNKYLVIDAQFNLVSRNFRKWCSENNVSRYEFLRNRVVTIDGLVYRLEEV